ncbi:PhoH family protein [Alloalcanivorax mobilis]|uniref:PhoH family protein n=1 Tax=Alloalcanivorax mobilis TaxID=2019569 RepID=UPI000B5B47AE|nr:PhoH family protein [Alloalcanivorax mobilis]ASK33136.1 ribonuclease [Alcanivorax sp. N3-2A]ASK36954.1 ribonuclease [Alcanivorax sp. N3-2A]|tara:strand:- start:176 stop:1624 length:1449 start_codon:yes stop_codon:yes gene_type:complete
MEDRAASFNTVTAASTSHQGKPDSSPKTYVLDTNVLIHDPNSLLNFEEHRITIPMTVLEELDRLKTGKSHTAADCRAAIRQIDGILGQASPAEVEAGIPIQRGENHTQGSLTVMMPRTSRQAAALPEHLNDNRIINDVVAMKMADPDGCYVLVTKDINMRLKARACGIDAEDYHNDQLVSDIRQLTRGYFEVPGSFWDRVTEVETEQHGAETLHRLSHGLLVSEILGEEVYPNQFIIDEHGFVARIVEVGEGVVTLRHHKSESLMEQQAWGLKPLNLQQAMALQLLLDPDIHLVTLTGAAGSGKTILALAAAIEMTVEQKRFNKIIATRSTPPLAEEHGFLPGTEEEKMDPWLGAINDNIEALHLNDENPAGSIQYVKERANIQFKALNYMRGRSFQNALILIDESQNLTPHQMKAIITRAGEGSKVVCLGNLAQIDTPYLSPTSSGLTYMTERFKQFVHGGSLQLNGVPRSLLAEYAETWL